MGFIRGGLLVIVCVVVFFSLLLGNIFWTVSSSLQYDNLKPEILEITSEMFGETSTLGQEIQTLLPTIQMHCELQSEYIFNYGTETIIIPCEIVLQGLDSIVEHVTKTLFDNHYYREYSCEFWDCLKEGETPFALISQTAQNYWQSRFLRLLLISLVLSIAIFFLVQNKTSFPILIGSIIAVSAIPIIWITKLTTKSMDMVGTFENYILTAVRIFFTQSQKVFLTMLGIGILVIIVGVALKLIKTGFRIVNVFSRIKERKSENQRTDKKASKSKK